MRIFISYAHSDEDSVRLLAERLRKGDHDVWFDDRLTGGKAWKKKLVEEIQAADCLIYALTPDSVDSAWCRWEFSQAVHMGKRVVPVLVKPVALEGILSEVQYVDFTQGDTVDFGIRLATAIFVAEIIPAEQVPLLPPPDSAEARRAEPESNGARADKVFDHAYDLFNSGNHEEARERLEICLNIDPGHPAAQKLLRVIEGRQKTAEPRRDVSRYVPTETTPDPDWADLLRQFRETAGFLVPEMVRIPGGPFLMGSDPRRDPRARKEERPQIGVTLPEYFIGRYPITTDEFRMFVNDGGYKHARWWTSSGWAWLEQKQRQSPGYWASEYWVANSKFPAVGVGWYEADAYARWLNAVWVAYLGPERAQSIRLEFRLPDEAEWEKAARGTDARIYPWGDHFDQNLCNVRETRIEQVTPVGQYSPGGDSPYGCADMAGNVWEWCLTPVMGDEEAPEFWSYANGPPELKARATSAGALRVLRGGSWINHKERARAAQRTSANPGSWSGNVGFRVCLAPPV